MSKIKLTGRDGATGRLLEATTEKAGRPTLMARMARSGAASPVMVSSGRIIGEIAGKQAISIRGRTKKVSVRVPEELIEHARETSGIEKEADLIKAGLAALAAPNAFGAWLIANEGALPEDFELDV